VTGQGYERSRSRSGQGERQVMSGQVMLGQVRKTSGQIRSDVARTVRTNFVLAQVMIMSDHIWTGHVKSGRIRAVTSHVGHVKSDQIKIKSGQGQSLSGHGRPKSE